MSLLKKSSVIGKDVAAEDRDVVGGGSRTFETDIYPADIDSMYMTQAKSGAIAVVVNLNIDGKKFSETMYITNAKGENTYTDKKTNKPALMPSLIQLNALSHLIIGKDLSEADTQERSLLIWDFESRKEVPTKVECLPEFFGKKIQVALVKHRKNKQAKVDDKYVPTNDAVESNTIEKFLSEDGFTRNEIKVKSAGEELKEPFAPRWLAQNKGKTRDAFKQVAGAPAAGAPTRAVMPPVATGLAAGATTDADDLFGEE